MEIVLQRLATLEAQSTQSSKLMQEEINSLREETTSLHEKTTSLCEENESLREENISLKKDVTTLKMDISGLNLCIDNLRTKVTRLELPQKEAAIAHLQLCIARRDQCEIDLITFRRKYSETVINADPILHSRHVLLMTARKEAWEAYFKAYDALYPKTIEDILWIMAKAGHTKLVAPLMNLSKVTRNCIHLQPIMMNVKLGRRGRTQLHFCVRKGLTSSVKRLLSIRNINVNVKNVNGSTPLHDAAWKGRVEIVRLLLQNGAEVNAKDNHGNTPLHCAASDGNVDILHLLVVNGADLEVQDDDGWRALHDAAIRGYLPIIQELISRYHVDINARDNDGRTALSRARHGFPHPHSTVISFLQSNGGI
jgi:FtsZ-binding cell division protein ZapB